MQFSARAVMVLTVPNEQAIAGNHCNSPIHGGCSHRRVPSQQDVSGAQPARCVGSPASNETAGQSKEACLQLLPLEVRAS